jgi:hypothetical protein
VAAIVCRQNDGCFKGLPNLLSDSWPSTCRDAFCEMLISSFSSFDPTETVAIQGCQMIYFQNKNHNLCKFWRALDWKMLILFMAIWNILRTFGIFYDHLVHIGVHFVHFSGFGMMHQEKSGNPVAISGEQNALNVESC